MERVHYRRVSDGSSDSHRLQGSSDGSASSFTEKLTVQAIVSALIMVAVLGICLLDFDFTLTARNSLRQALEGQTTFDGLVTDIQLYTDSLLGRDTVTLPAEVIPTDDPSEVIPANKIDAAVSGEESKSTVPELPISPEP